jgi:hypothetical protein
MNRMKSSRSFLNLRVSNMPAIDKFSSIKSVIVPFESSLSAVLYINYFNVRQVKNTSKLRDY